MLAFLCKDQQGSVTNNNVFFLSSKGNRLRTHEDSGGSEQLVTVVGFVSSDVQ